MANGRPWTLEEEAKLIDLRSRNVTFKNCVEHFEGRTAIALRFKTYNLTNVLNIKESTKKEKFAVFDIETTNFKANIGYMLSWAVYYPDEDRTVWDVINKDEIFELKRDARICQTLIDELKGVDILMGYNSTRFDIPFWRTRCIANGLLDQFPKYGEMRHIDVYYYSRSKVATHRKSLDTISTFLGVGGKTPVDIGVWADAQLGHKPALDKVLEHNIIDVKVTWDTYKMLQPYGKFTAKSI
ncbi:MAG: hypothetical protein DRJ03_19860 [Chloroflexi bacterium]|nr:MAG: hypothetical protein DRJ03_19860 [Chloroflexota bacterium]